MQNLLIVAVANKAKAGSGRQARFETILAHAGQPVSAVLGQVSLGGVIKTMHVKCALERGVITLVEPANAQPLPLPL